MEVELIISGRDDRKTVASILVDNGYAVKPARKPKASAEGRPMKAYDQVLLCEYVKGGVDQ